MPSREELNEQLKTFLGLDLDNDILGWMGGDYALVADLDMMAVLDMVESGAMRDLTLDPRLPSSSKANDSDKPAKSHRCSVICWSARTKNMQDAPKISLTTEDGFTTVIIEDVPLSPNPEILLDIQMTGNGEFFLVGDQATVESILSGDGDRLTGDASFVEAAQYILPNANSIAYAGGEGWGDLFTVAALVGISSSPGQNGNDQVQMVIDVLRASYDIIGSSSISAAYNEDGSQTSRIVLTLK
ncbi:hypothetical protein HC776_01940 [bacterium]|nr:hypothetical protein [bacterium]